MLLVSFEYVKKAVLLNCCSSGHCCIS